MPDANAVHFGSGDKARQECCPVDEGRRAERMCGMMMMEDSILLAGLYVVIIGLVCKVRRLH